MIVANVLSHEEVPDFNQAVGRYWSDYSETGRLTAEIWGYFPALLSNGSINPSC
jgi:hypothetical protein